MGHSSISKRRESDKIIALGGNPNVGKSTVFNELTGLRQHTGNWPGKTVSTAQGYCTYSNTGYVIVDLPGCYSLAAQSAEEEAARDFLCGGEADAVIMVCDATCLERGLILVLQALEICPNVAVCVNLMDEADKKGIDIDLESLSHKLGVPVIGTSARSKRGLEALMRAVAEVIAKVEPEGEKPCPEFCEDAERFVHAAEEICRDSVSFRDSAFRSRDMRLDAVLTGRRTAFPIMLLALLAALWLTIAGANYPSQWLSAFLFWIEDRLLDFFVYINAPEVLYKLLVQGIYRVLAWVVSVMLPPMAIFFPLFTLLEDAGFLPRVAFNLDKCFKKCQTCGKQALTMCLGLGCNAVGVTGCRIIDSPRERLIAIITNSLIPCNGRFPIFIAIISMFFIGSTSGIGKTFLSALLLTCVIVAGIAATFAVSGLLSKTLLKGLPSSFTLELPPYRRPQIGRVIVRSVLDRTIFVLGRAVCAAIPAGLLIWLLANNYIGDSTLLSNISGFLDPFGRLLGMDGVILLAFILGFPANEIVVPIIIMAYMAEGSLLEIENLSVLKQLLTDNGWTWTTAVSTLLFTLIHWPCSTTCLTVKKETGSVKWTAVSILIPTILGVSVCLVFNLLLRGLGGLFA